MLLPLVLMLVLPVPLSLVLQTKCVRYYMVFQRALAVMKRVLAAEGHATDASNAPGEAFQTLF